MAALSYEPKDWISPQQYLEIERNSEEKHEYIDGEIRAMAGASINHNRININIAASIHSQLRGSSRETMSNDQRVRVPDSRLYTYPDVMIVCGEPQFDDQRNGVDTITNPSVLIEVLSPSTAAKDKGDKFDWYQCMTSLQDYVLVSQNSMRVEHYARQSDHSWLLRVFENSSDTLQLTGAPTTLLLGDVYERVSLETNYSNE